MFYFLIVFIILFYFFNCIYFFTLFLFFTFYDSQAKISGTLSIVLGLFHILDWPKSLLFLFTMALVST